MTVPSAGLSDRPRRRGRVVAISTDHANCSIVDSPARGDGEKDVSQKGVRYRFPLAMKKASGNVLPSGRVFTRNPLNYN